VSDYGFWVILQLLRSKVFLWAYGFLVFFAWGIILMDDMSLFICGIVVTLISGMGVITSQVFMGYDKFLKDSAARKIEDDEQIEQTV
jgi:hypothetical protein